MTGRPRHISADINGNPIIMGKKNGSLPSRERLARFMLKIVLRVPLNIPSQSSAFCNDRVASHSHSKTTVLRQLVLNQPIGVIIFATTDIIFSKF